ncbi:GTP-binding protein BRASSINAZOLE INSENSITIVE PALE GREEN 2, chloroplastic-like [Papaver somniferum]|uniref:GTP-binding protein BRASSINAZOLE INSENSITIVE PALE GREEN 2, chloroplastic-like n=1 Tax=Papaver somniferum TaxID=3469 RepID=UPI000E6FB876|nr:GTP-binding protein BRASSINAZOLE INSENSITIVE PALE GREEN 2, chloroplastic-like [Papaver somniferum]
MLARKLSASKFKHGFRLSFITSSSQVSKFQSLNSHLLSNFNSAPYNQYPHQSPSNLPRFFTSESQTCFKFIREGNFDVNSSQNHLVCPGCGVHMQGLDPKLPGYFLKPSEKNPDYKMKLDRKPSVDESEISNSMERGNLDEIDDPEEATEFGSKPGVCARCHSLRYRRRLNDAAVEKLLPDFDFDHTIGRKLVSTSGAQSIVLMVVDAVDFDGSFPRKIARLISDIEENSVDWKQGKTGNVPRVVLVVTKIDLLPPCVSPTRLEDWVRTRAREGGANNVTSVHLVSAVRGWGLKHLVDDVCKLAGAIGNVWAVGAQNSGKSTLINSISRHASGGEATELTEAPVPGTTLGIIRVEGVLPGEAKLFDTPGLLHPHQLTTRLTWEEQKLVQIRKKLKPRTYRIKAGYTVHIAGLMRLTVEETSLDTVYVTVWASPHLPLHMGKPKHVETMLERHVGHELQPPVDVKRVKELGNWVRSEFCVSGNSWDVSSMDVSVSGVGWFAVGLKGEARLGVWTYDAIDVTLRNSLIPQRSNYFQVPGFIECKKLKKQMQRKETRFDSSLLPDNAADTSSC